MKNINKLICGLGVAVLGLATFTSCEEETHPTSYATVDQMAQSSSATEALLSAIPASLNSHWQPKINVGYSWGYGSLMKIRDIMTGDYTNVESNYDHYSSWAQCYYIGKGYLSTQFVWNYYWSMVLTTNNLISGIDASKATSEQLGYLGVGYAERASMYLDMARMYEFLPNEKYPDGKNENGKVVTNLTVPIVKAGMSEDSARVNPRATREQMAEFILGDLDKAEQYIVNLTDNRAKTLPNLACVYGLKARCYMWLEDYAQAKVYARKAIDASGLTPMTQAQALNPTTGFNTADPWMWASTLTAENATVQTGILNWVSWMSNETQWGYASAGPQSMISKSVYDRISDTDWRKLEWKAPDDSPLASQVPFLNSTYKQLIPTYGSIKFRPGNGNDADGAVGNVVSYPLMRVEEMYLIEAEAAAHQDVAEGKKLIENFMKNYRDAKYVCKANSKDALVDEIVFQKRVELWGEGQSFFDIKRLNYSVTRGYAGTNFYPLCRFNTNGRPAWMNFVIVQTEENNNAAVNGWNNPDPSDKYTPVQ